MDSFKRFCFQNFKRISPWIHVLALNSYLCTEFLNESLCFQRFYVRFLSNKCRHVRRNSILSKICIEENFVATVLYVRCTFRCVRNRFQPQTSLWNYEKAMLIKIVAMFRNLSISSSDATTQVKRAFIYFKPRTSNDCEVTAMHSMRPIDRTTKSNFKEKD